MHTIFIDILYVIHIFLIFWIKCNPISIYCRWFETEYICFVFGAQYSKYIRFIYIRFIVPGSIGQFLVSQMYDFTLLSTISYQPMETLPWIPRFYINQLQPCLEYHVIISANGNPALNTTWSYQPIATLLGIPHDHINQLQPFLLCHVLILGGLLIDMLNLIYCDRVYTPVMDGITATAIKPYTLKQPQNLRNSNRNNRKHLSQQVYC